MTLFTGGTESDITIGGVTYRVHRFTASGTLTLVEAGEVEYLVVAGGGGSGGGASGVGAGGGGGGGLLEGTILVSATQTITVGPGGIAGRRVTDPGGASRGGNGGNSSIGALLSALGGGGGGFATVSNGLPGNGASGGSGGGGGEGGPGATGSVGGTGATGTAGQGNDGADGIDNWAAGSGGGAGGDATPAPNSTTDSTPGPGLASSITGTPVTYAAGGRTFRTSNSSSNAVANTGNGAAGVNETFPGRVGGSGIVIVRYPLVSPSWHIGMSISA